MKARRALVCSDFDVAFTKEELHSAALSADVRTHCDLRRLCNDGKQENG